MQNSGSGKAVASMVLGILSIVLCYVPVLGLVLALIGLPLAISAMRANPAGSPGATRGIAIAGLVTSIIGLVIGILYIVGIAVVGCVGMNITMMGNDWSYGYAYPIC